MARISTQALIVIIVLLNVGVAQTPATGNLSGEIVTAEGNPAEDVTILLRKTSRGTVSGQDGRFQIRRIPEGEYTIEVSLMNYETVSKKVTIRAGITEHMEITLALSHAELEQVVFSNASGSYKVSKPSPSLRLQAPLLDIPQNIQVVTEKTLRDQQVNDMLEGVIRNVSGATRVDSWDNYADITMRGASITAFRNGMNVKSPWGPLLEDMSIVDRIEFVKGPAGFMLANGEPTGFYNVVTKKPTGVNRGEITTTLGSFDLYRTTLDLDGVLSKNGKMLYRLNLMAQQKNYHRDFDYNKRYSIAPVIRYRFNDQTSLTAEYTFQHMQMAMLGSAYVFSPKKYGELPRNFSLLEPNFEPSNIDDHTFFVTFEHQLQEHWTFTGKLAYLNYQQTGSSIWLAYPVGLDSAGNATRSVANWDGFNEARLGQAFVNGEFHTGAFRHRVLGGLDLAYKNYYADFYQTFNLAGYNIYAELVPFNIYKPVHGFVPASDLPRFDRSLPLRQRGGGTLGESSSSLYLQDELGLVDDKVRLTLAGRYTKLRQHSYGTYSEDDQFTPRVGLSVSLDKSTSLYALYDQAFVAQQGADSARRPFVPVTGNNQELGLKRDWSGGRFSSTLAAYRLTRNNVITVVPGPEYKTIQTGQTVTRGAELDFRGELVSGLNLVLNYAYTESEITRDADPSKLGSSAATQGFAAHIANGWLAYRLNRGILRGLGAGLGYRYQGGRAEELPDYFRADASLSWQAARYTVSLNANNLFDRYLISGGSLFEHNNDPSSTEYNYQIEPGFNLRILFAYRF